MDQPIKDIWTVPELDKKNWVLVIMEAYIKSYKKGYRTKENFI